VLETTNGGASWVAQNPSTPLHLREIDFLDATSGYVVGYFGTIRKTVDGQTWLPEVSPTTSHLRDVQFPEQITTGFAVGNGGSILKRVVE
jgi:photosystem II stability/assembly factor-like uncharacterized protein